MTTIESRHCEAVAGGADRVSALDNWPIDVPLHSLPFRPPPPEL